MRKHSLVFSITMVSALVLTLSAVALAADPHIGTWKLNLAKSKYNHPSSAPNSQTVKFEALDNGFKAVWDGVDAAGKTYHGEWTGKYDGKDYPVKGWEGLDTIETRKADAYTFESTLKRGGKKVGAAHEAFSKGGKTFTHTYEIKNAQGQVTKVTDVFDKQ